MGIEVLGRLSNDLVAISNAKTVVWTVVMGWECWVCLIVFLRRFFCICNENVMCHWFGNGVGVVSDDRGFRCAWRCSCARIGTF